MTNAMVAIFASILGILGLWLSDKDNKIAAAQYIVVGLGLFIAIGAFGILGFIFFVIAALLSFRDKVQIESTEKIGGMNKLWFVPIVSLILLMIVGAGMESGIESNTEENSKAITINDISNTISNSYGYYTGDLLATLSSSKAMDYIQVEVDYYDESGVKIDSSPFAFNENNIVPNHKYKIKAYYHSEEKPSKAEIKVYSDLSSSNLLYSKNVTL
jgi:hypothetical protein